MTSFGCGVEKEKGVFLMFSMEKIQLAALSHNFRVREKCSSMYSFSSNSSFCLNFIGKDEVFHGLLFIICQMLNVFT